MKYLTNKDDIVVSSFDFTKNDTFFYFDNAVSQSKIDVEVCVYDNNTKQLANTYNLNFVDFNKSEFLTIIPASTDSMYGGLNINTPNLLEYYGYIRGNYRVTYKFYFNTFGTNENRLFIRKISSSRKEIIVDYMDSVLLNDYKNFTNNNFYRFSRNFTFNKLLNFGADTLLLVLNSKNQSDAFGNSLILKLYQPLPSKFTNKDTLWVVSLLTDEMEDIVNIDFEVKINTLDTANILRAPNYSKEFDNIGTDYTTYKKYADLVDTSSLGEKYFAGFNNTDNGQGIDLDIKYQYFDSFVNFGSATQMLENFKAKIESMQHYNTSSLKGINSSGPALSSSLYYKNKELEIIGGFTPYETFLYYENAKYFTSSLYGISNIDATWPKSGSTSSTYVLYPISSSEVQNWYATMSAVSFDYDYENTNALVRTLPEYIINDILNNQQYISFVNMIGEFYDNIWLYVLSMQRMLKRENKFEDGVPGELVWNILRNYGLNLNSGQNLVDLTRYKYAYNVSSSGEIVDLQRTEQTVTQEIWNRILNNYPYIFKSKGTEKSIRALFNCYGIPNSLIEIQEFGGPYLTSSFDSASKYSFTYEDFTFVLQMTGDDYIHIPWQTSYYDDMVPDSIEFKMRTPASSGDMDVFTISGSSNGEVKLQLINTVQEFGKFVLTIGGEQITSSVKPFYNNEFYSVMVKRSLESDNPATPQNYYISIRNHDDYTNRIILHEDVYLSTSTPATNSAYIDTASLYLGGAPTSTQKFIGAFDEFRLWSEVLTDETFDFHTKYSAATNGNTITSSLSSLAFRLSFNSALNLITTSSMPSDAFNTSSYGNGAETASAYMINSGSTYSYNFADFERSNTVEQKFIAADIQNNKIRIEGNSIEWSGLYTGSNNDRLYPLKGNYMISDYTPVGEVGDFDNAPPDVDTLLIGFTPVAFNNRDIIAFYGNNDILSAYGDFNNLYEAQYPKNNFIIDTYWHNTKTAVSFDEYLKYIRTYDRSLFDVVRELIPAKASPILGTVYEQNILRRNRVKLLSPEVAINYNQYIFKINQKEYSIVDDIVANDEASEGKINVSQHTSLLSSYEDLQALILQPIVLLPQQFDEIMKGEYVYKLNELNLIAYNDLYVNRQRTNTDRFRNLTTGAKNSSLTTSDRGPAVVITSSSPKKLIVNYADNPKLIVKN